MIRLSKLADYGIVLLAYFVDGRGGTDEGVWASRELADASRLPLPTVAKVMKSLCRSGLVQSQRGVYGGYRLARPADRISVIDIITAMEGPISLTECSRAAPQGCELEPACPVSHNWQRINRVVIAALTGLTLQDMQRPQTQPAASDLASDLSPSDPLARSTAAAPV
jgi:FeS assembly SUF system regulator